MPPFSYLSSHQSCSASLCPCVPFVPPTHSHKLVQGFKIDPSGWNKKLGKWRVWVSYSDTEGFDAGSAAYRVSQTRWSSMVLLHLTSSEWTAGPAIEVLCQNVLLALHSSSSLCSHTQVACRRSASACWQRARFLRWWVTNGPGT